MGSSQITLYRHQLHAKVWQRPIGSLSREMNISAASLREACKAMAILLPPLGHWMAVKAGTAAPAPALAPHDGTEVYVINERKR